MAEKDVSSKILTNYNDVFADVLTKITKNSPTSISGGMNWHFFVVKFLKIMYNIFSSNYMKGII